MRVFIAGGSGAIGRCLVPMLVKDGHLVTAMTRTLENAQLLQTMGAIPVIGDVFDATGLAELVTDAKPDVAIHQLTAFGAKDADPLAETIRVRKVGTRNLIQAARAADVKRFITQSISFICSPSGAGLTNEETPLYLDAPDTIRSLAESVAEMERLTLQTEGIEGVVLRYGWFYGNGTNYDPAGSIPRSVRKGRAPIVGEGAGVYSFIHVHDAAQATMKALVHAKSGIYNIVDNEPAPLNVWLPAIAQLLQAPAPTQLAESIARERMGDMLVYVMNEQRGALNTKAKNELHWEPYFSSWRDGFKALYAASEK